MESNTSYRVVNSAKKCLEVRGKNAEVKSTATRGLNFGEFMIFAS